MNNREEFVIDSFGKLTSYSGNESVVNIPNGVIQVGPYSFAMNKNIIHVICPDTLVSIEEGAFEKCVRLQRIEFGTSLSSIGEGAFFECYNLKHLYLPASVSFIDSWAFTSCTNLNSIDVSAENIAFSSIDGVLFNKDFTSLLVFPNSNRLEYSLPDSVVEIRLDAFFRCSTVRTISINEHISNLSYEYFEGCVGLHKILVHSNNPHFKSLCGALFTKDSSIGVYFPISNDAVIQLPANTASLSVEFSGNTQLSSRLVLNKNINFIYFENLFLIDIIRNSAIAVVNPYISEYNLSEFLFSFTSGLFQYNSFLETIILPDNLISVPSWCFDSCFSLKQVLFSDSILEIQDNAFRDCHHLENVKFPPNLTYIGDKAFLKCGNLIHLSFPPSVISIGEYAFFGCDSLEDIKFSSQMISIPKLAFAFCPNLKRVFIPDSITYIDESAFYHSTSKLTFICSSNSYSESFAISHGIRYLHS